MISRISINSDSIGAMSSSLCLVHCIATPLLFVIQPLGIQDNDAPMWWQSVDYIFLAISFFAVYWSSKHTSENWMRYLFWAIWGLLTLGILNEKFELFHLPELVIYIPALGLVFLHLYNRRYCQCADKECCANTKGSK